MNHENEVKNIGHVTDGNFLTWGIYSIYKVWSFQVFHLLKYKAFKKLAKAAPIATVDAAAPGSLSLCQAFCDKSHRLDNKTDWNFAYLYIVCKHPSKHNRHVDQKFALHALIEEL